MTVSKDRAGRYFVSFQCEDEVGSRPEVKAEVAVDLGLSHLGVFSTGEKVESQRFFIKHERRLATLQRRLSRKQIGSNNRVKARLKVARAHARIADARRDFLHKLSTRVINENPVIAHETLGVKHRQGHRRLSKAIGDASWSAFILRVRYKTAWYGRQAVGIERFEPTSQRCSACGAVRGTLSLSQRSWSCQCGATHDRDVNAAINSLTAGHAVLPCGETVSPATP